MSSNQINIVSKESKLCTIAGIKVAAFLGGPLGAFYLISKNFRILGNRSEAKKNLLYGVIFSAILVLIILLPFQVVNKIPTSMFPVLYTVIIGIYASKLQGQAINEALLNGIKKYPKLKILGVSILSFISLLSVIFFLLLCKTGDLSRISEYSIGWIYHKGIIVSQNDTESIKWMQKAAAKNDQLAENALAYAYQKGIGVPQNDTQAFQWLLKAAEQGNATAQTNIGYAYYTGQGVPQNYAEAVIWIRKAAEQGVAEAQFNLAQAYYNGTGMPQNNIEAGIWIKKAATQGFPPAQYALAMAYHSGIGMPQNTTEAIVWLKRAAARGFPPAQKLLQHVE